jgi:hypothetical protein
MTFAVRLLGGTEVDPFTVGEADLVDVDFEFRAGFLWNTAERRGQTAGRLPNLSRKSRNENLK